MESKKVQLPPRIEHTPPTFDEIMDKVGQSSVGEVAAAVRFEQTFRGSVWRAPEVEIPAVSYAPPHFGGGAFPCAVSL